MAGNDGDVVEALLAMARQNQSENERNGHGQGGSSAQGGQSYEHEPGRPDNNSAWTFVAPGDHRGLAIKEAGVSSNATDVGDRSTEGVSKGNLMMDQMEIDEMEMHRMKGEALSRSKLNAHRDSGPDQASKVTPAVEYSDTGRGASTMRKSGGSKRMAPGNGKGKRRK